MGFRYIHIFSHLNYKLTVSFLDNVFIIFENEYAITLNKRLCGFNFVVIFLIIFIPQPLLVLYVWILIIVHLHGHFENPSIKDIYGPLHGVSISLQFLCILISLGLQINNTVIF